MHRSLVLPARLLVLLVAGCDSDSECTPSDWPGSSDGQPSVRISLDVVEAAYPWTLAAEDASGCDVSPNDVDETSPTFLDDYRGSRTEGCGLVLFESVGAPRQRVYDAASGELVGYRQTDDVATTFAGTTCTAVSFVAGIVPVPGCPGAETFYCRTMP